MNAKLSLIALAALVSAAIAAPATAATFSPGSKSLGDPMFPQIGNGGYDVLHYEVDLDYDPVANRFETGTQTAIIARAGQNLSRFSLDFQKNLTVDSVEVGGDPATYTRADAQPKLSDDPAVTQPAKLTITPAEGIEKGDEMKVVVRYHGQPQAIVDTDGSLEGWVQACSTIDSCDGSFTVSEPIGAQSWFPSNNHPSDKATFTLHTTAPSAYTAIGAGIETNSVDNGDGTTTTTWVEDSPIATYLTTGTVGLFDVDRGSMTDDSDGDVIPTFTAIDSAGSTERKDEVAAAAARIPEMVNFLSKRFGGYPFESVGVVADWVPSVGYELENQTKPHFAGNPGGPAVDDSTLAHELMHQWTGDAVSPAQWDDIWFNEGWATFSEVLFDHQVDGAEMSPRRFFELVHASRKQAFELPPATLDHDPSQLFNGFAVYNRPGAMIEGYREIVGNKTFFAFATGTIADHAYADISTREFVREAKRASDLRGKRLKRLGRYFDQWLYGKTRPALTPADFR